MFFSLRNTFRRGRSGVPDNLGADSLMALQTLSVGIGSFNHYRHTSLLLGAGLTDLAADDFVDILDALALIRLGRTLLADFRGELADLLLVGAGDDDLVGGGNIDGDAVDLGDD